MHTGGTGPAGSSCQEKRGPGKRGTRTRNRESGIRLKSRLWVQLNWHHWLRAVAARVDIVLIVRLIQVVRHLRVVVVIIPSSSSTEGACSQWAVSRRPGGGQNLHFRVEGLTPLATAGRSFCYLPQNPPAAARRPRARWRLHSGSRPNRETGVWSARWVRAEWESRTLGPGRRCQSEASSESVPPRRLGRASPPGPGALACRQT